MSPCAARVFTLHITLRLGECVVSYLYPIAVALLMLAHLPVCAQDSPTEQYLLRTGDVIRITVLGHAEYSTPELQIQPDGRVMHPVAGAVTAAGRSQAAVAEDIRRALLSELREPRVVVSVVEYKRDLVFVTGAVHKPGAYPLGEGLTVRQAIALAGGAGETADLGQALLICRDGSRREFSLGEPREGAAVGDDQPIESGSTLFLPERAPRNIAVLGAVRTPGIHDMPRTGLRLSEAVALVGGFTEDAAPEQARLTRSGAPTTTVDLRKLTDDANDPANVELEHGDALLVPSRPPQTFAVLGDVRNPGVKPLDEAPLRLSAALALAGGITDTADAEAVVIVGRTGPPSRVDLTDMLHGHAPDDDRIISPGDVIFVPKLVMPQVVVLGNVRSPGRHALDGGTRVSDALAKAGGLHDDPDRVQTSILHADGTTREVDVARVLDQSDARANVQLADGDTIIVRSLDRGQVTVLGAVRSPGRFDIRQARRLTDLLALAAPLPHAARTASLLRPDGSSVEVDITASASDRAGLELRDGDILVVESDESRVVILGAVNQPGQYVVSKAARFSDALAAAGGLAPGARVRRASVIHRDGDRTDVDLEKVLTGADRAADVPLRDGDAILADAAPARQVSVLGRVSNPGKYTLDEGDRVSDVIARSGGLAADADERVGTLMRADGTVIRVDLRAVLRMEDARANLPVMPGDTFVVDPARASYVGVMGAVNAPGYFPFEQDERLEDVLAKAGGPTETADLGRCTLRSRDGATTSMDLRGIRTGDLRSGLPLLQDGDTIFVPSLAIGQAAVLGAVHLPGRHEIQEGDRVSTMLARAGGVTGNATSGELIHADGSATPVNLERAVAQAGSQQDPAVADGDTLVVAARRPITVLGAVRSAGVYELATGTRLSTALARAGGLSPAADPTEVTLIREGAEPRKLNLGRSLDLSDPATDIALEPGDVVLVPEVSRHVSLMGAVRRPGRYPLPHDARLTDALALAGGVERVRIGEVACTVLREGKRIAVNLADVMTQDDSQDNLLLVDGDTVLLEPAQPISVAVLGKVGREGRHELESGARLAHAIAMAGGLKEGADPRRVRVRRGEDVLTVDMSGLRSGEDLAEDVALHNDDIIVVPQTTHTVSVLGAVRSPGIYQFEPGDVLIDVVARAGGWIERDATPNRTLLIRRAGETAQWASVDLLKAAGATDEQDNPKLADADIVYVPTKSQTLDTVLKTIFPVTSLLRLVF